jgi:hypothetical protein
VDTSLTETFEKTRLALNKASKKVITAKNALNTKRAEIY